uniref:Uncharacterized protein n=1 Tax=Timema bartmani TaxID=61472 RepID=A0A7R9FBD2_9NEOP|nr:unnamed protein product [Timema bartmani]
MAHTEMKAKILPSSITPRGHSAKIDRVSSVLIKATERGNCANTPLFRPNTGAVWREANPHPLTASPTFTNLIRVSTGVVVTKHVSHYGDTHAHILVILTLMGCTEVFTLWGHSRSRDAPRYSHYGDTHAHTLVMLTLMVCTEVFTLWGHSRSNSRHAHAHGMHRGIHTMGTLTLTFSSFSRSWDAPRYSHYGDTHAMLTLMGCTEIFTLRRPLALHSGYDQNTALKIFSTRIAVVIMSALITTVETRIKAIVSSLSGSQVTGRLSLESRQEWGVEDRLLDQSVKGSCHSNRCALPDFLTVTEYACTVVTRKLPLCGNYVPQPTHHAAPKAV